MDDGGFSKIADELNDLLEEERSALLAGDLAQIGRSLERKESLVEQFSTLAARDSKRLDEVSKRLDRNQGLLDSALDGIRSVTNRLALLKRVHKSLDTYDSNGVKLTVDLRNSASVEKRA